MLSVQKHLPDMPLDFGQTGPKYVTKTLKMPNGQWAVVTFELGEQQGKIIAKAISAELIAEPIVTAEETLALPVVCVACAPEVIASPFFADIETVLKDLSFVTAQPTRGPSLS